MNKKLKDEVDRIFRSLLQPIEEYEAIVRDGVIHPRKIDLIREYVNLFTIMELGEHIRCAESATIGLIHGISFNPIKQFWSKKLEENKDDEEKLTEVFENYGKDMSIFTKMFHSHLPKLKERIQLVKTRLEEEDQEFE